MFDWNDLRYVLEVHRQGSFTAAARALKVDQTTATRRLQAIEDGLGAKLFDRTTSGPRLTDAGARILGDAEHVEEVVLNLERKVSGEDAKLEGIVRLTTVQSFADGFLIPRMGALQKRHPGIVLQIMTHARIFDLARREADIAIRSVRPEQQNLVGRKLGQKVFALYASSEYLARGRVPTAGKSLAGLDVVAYENRVALVEESHWFVGCCRHARVAFRATETISLMEACKAGLGLAVLPCFLADRESALRRVWAQEIVVRDLWAVYHADMQRNARIRAVVAHLADVVAAHRALLEGRSRAAHRRTA